MLTKGLCPVPRKRDNSPYPNDFKIEAGRLLRESGESLREMFEDLGVSANPLREWSQRFDTEAGKLPGLNSRERSELRRLRREDKVPPEKRETLKRAAVASMGQRNSVCSMISGLMAAEISPRTNVTRRLAA